MKISTLLYIIISKSGQRAIVEFGFRKNFRHVRLYKKISVIAKFVTYTNFLTVRAISRLSNRFLNDGSCDRVDQHASWVLQK